MFSNAGILNNKNTQINEKMFFPAGVPTGMEFNIGDVRASLNKTWLMLNILTGELFCPLFVTMGRISHER